MRAVEAAHEVDLAVIGTFVLDADSVSFRIHRYGKNVLNVGQSPELSLLQRGLRGIAGVFIGEDISVIDCRGAVAVQRLRMIKTKRCIGVIVIETMSPDKHRRIL